MESQSRSPTNQNFYLLPTLSVRLLRSSEKKDCWSRKKKCGKFPLDKSLRFFQPMTLLATTAEAVHYHEQDKHSRQHGRNRKQKRKD